MSNLSCDCQINHQKGIFSGACINTIPYVARSEYMIKSHYVCKDCFENCLSCQAVQN
jgi:hypothetical protein